MAERWNCRRLLWLIPVVLVGLAWWACRPAYIDLSLSLKPFSTYIDKSYSTYYTSDLGGSTYYVVRWQGLVIDDNDWPREKVFEHFEELLLAHGWERSGSEQNGAGIFSMETYHINAIHRRYKNRGASDTYYPHVCVTILYSDHFSDGGHTWYFVVESVNPSWLTSFKHALDD